MGISSLGVGSSILTQDVLDQLRAADEAGRIKPITLSLANEGDKKDALELIDANMTNLIDSINEIKNQALYDGRQASVTGTSVGVVAAANTDIQDFTLDVVNLATKQIEQSGSFALGTSLVGDGVNGGDMNLNINGKDYVIPYLATTTLEELKNSINTIAGADVDATLLNVGANDVRLVISSANTGSNQNISLTDSVGSTGTLNANLTQNTSFNVDPAAIDPATSLPYADLQSGIDSNFTFNGQAITRSSNNVTDLITGLDITLKEVGVSNVSVTQDRTTILEKFDSFVEKYNSAITELNKMTVSSTDSQSRGIFSAESTIKGMKRDIENIISTVGGGVGSLFDYGFDVDKDGTMTLDQAVLNTKLDANSANVEVFFSGGNFDNGDGTTTAVGGAFTEISTMVEGYTKYNATLDQFQTSITDRISSLEDRKLSATEKLDAKYEIMKKRFTAYDLIISKFNSASSMFVQMANASMASNN